MEEEKTLRLWFSEYQNSKVENEGNIGKENDKAVVFDKVIAPYLGDYTAISITDEKMNSFWNKLKVLQIDKSEVFAVFAVLKSLFTYMKNCGVDTPTLQFKSVFNAMSGLAEEVAIALNEKITETVSREMFFLWLVLHTGIPVKILLGLKRNSLSVKNGVLTVSYLTESVEETEKISLMLGGKDATFLRKCFRKIPKNRTVIATGTEEPANRRAMQSVLSSLAKECGYTGVTLSQLEKTEWSYDEVEEEDGYFLSDNEDDESPKEKKQWKFAVSRKRLNAKMRTMRTPVLEHARRVRQFASFIVEHLGNEPWFLEYDLSNETLVKAVYYHDIGKLAIPLDDYYDSGYTTQKQLDSYRSHVAEGLKIVQKETEERDLVEFEPDTLEGAIRDVVNDHHERYDGKGFPGGKKGEEISFVGRLCAVVDEIDHSLFLNKGKEVEVSEVLAKIKDGIDKKYDPKIVRVLLENAIVFASFVEEVRAFYLKKRRTDEYGMRFCFAPLLNTVDNKTVAYNANLFLNDPYYGMVSARVILPTVEQNSRFFLFERLEIERICRLIGQANETNKNIPPVFLHFSLRELERSSFFTNLFQLFVNYGIRFQQITFSVDEEDVVGSGVDVSAVANSLHTIGSRFAIEGFGSGITLLPSLAKIQPDVLILRKEFAQIEKDTTNADMLEMIMRSATRQNIEVYCCGVVNAEQAKRLQDYGISVVGGEFAGVELTEKEFLTRE